MPKGFVAEIPVNTVIRKGFGKDFLFAVRSGSGDSISLLQSFGLEKEVRDEWWRIQKGDIVLDIGAAHGSYTLPALADGAMVVFAFEPDKSCIFDLLLNIMTNGFSGRGIVLPVLIGEKDGSTDYWPEQHSVLGKGVGRCRRVVLCLDTFCESFGLPKVDWIKIDVEGIEMEVLRGAKRAIQKYSPKILIENHVVIVPDILEQVRNFMFPLGYTEENFAKNPGTNENWSLWSKEDQKSLDTTIINLTSIK